MKKWIFNPFTYIAGGQALAIGLPVMLLTAVVAHYSNQHFDGAIDAHFGSPTTFANNLLEQLIAWGSVVLVFYALAFALSTSKFRFIDIAGTIAVARIPMLLVAVLAFAPMPDMSDMNHLHITPSFLIVTILMVFCAVWMIVLMYKAFIISFNLKGTKAVTGFIGGILAAEVLAAFLFRLIIK